MVLGTLGLVRIQDGKGVKSLLSRFPPPRPDTLIRMRSRGGQGCIWTRIRKAKAEKGVGSNTTVLVGEGNKVK